MMMPNPSQSYIDLDVDPAKTTALAATSENNITVNIVDKMGTVVIIESITSLPHRFDTSKLDNGEYMATILTEKKGGSSKDQRVESILFIVSH